MTWYHICKEQSVALFSMFIFKWHPLCVFYSRHVLSDHILIWLLYLFFGIHHRTCYLERYGTKDLLVCVYLILFRLKTKLHVNFMMTDRFRRRISLFILSLFRIRVDARCSFLYKMYIFQTFITSRTNHHKLIFFLVCNNFSFIRFFSSFN